MTGRSQKRTRSQRHAAIERLTAGAKQFNSWRNAQNLEFLDLSGCNLVAQNLRGVNLVKVRLSKALLAGASLRAADLRGANLNGADLENADLTSADLRGARLMDANLTNANINDSHLHGTLREGWCVRRVKCLQCWITGEADTGAPADRFDPGEFELTYGGRRVKVRFTSGLEPIDLIALPFYFQRLHAQFPDARLVLAGLGVFGEPTLEVRVEHDARPDLGSALQNAFDDGQVEWRREALDSLKSLVDAQRDTITVQSEAMRLLTDGLRAVSAQTRDTIVVKRMEISMDEYKVEQATVVGPNAHVRAGDINQSNRAGRDANYFRELTNAFTDLADEFRRSAKSDEERQASKALTEATEALRHGSEQKALAALKRGGRLVGDFASKVGASLVSEYLKKHIGV